MCAVGNIEMVIAAVCVAKLLGKNRSFVSEGAVT
jgi:hypothetical protein